MRFLCGAKQTADSPSCLVQNVVHYEVLVILVFLDLLINNRLGSIAEPN